MRCAKDGLLEVKTDQINQLNATIVEKDGLTQQKSDKIDQVKAGMKAIEASALKVSVE